MLGSLRKTQPAGTKSAKPRPAPDTPRPAAKRDVRPERLAQIFQLLDQHYPDPECALTHRSPWELLVATILSAQCTDVRVNLVTPALFAAYPTPQAMAEAPIEALEDLVRTTGFFHNKAKSIQGAGRVIHTQFHDQVPQTMDELLTVPGAARKTASVVLGVCFGKSEGIVVDTHVFRLSRRLGLAKGNNPQKVEQELMKIIPRDRWIQLSHQLIHHGRALCDARKPKCSECPFEPICQAKDKSWSS